MALKIFYWSPIISKIATTKAVINSAKSLKIHSKNFDCTLINTIGEFNTFKRMLQKHNIKLNNFYKFDIIRYLPNKGYFFSRLSFLIIFLLSFFKLKNLLVKNKPDYLIIHLITSLPLLLNLIYNFETKFILRISGLPRLNLFRRLFWKNALKRVHYITCPTEETKKLLIMSKLVRRNQVMVLEDPIINPVDFKNLEKTSKYYKKKYKNFIFCAGRLTIQKNFELIIKSFHHVSSKINNLNLVIAGDGEQRHKLIKLIRSLKLEKRVYLIGYNKNIYELFQSCKIFCLPSLWEDPGFVLIEAAFCKSNIVSSNCPNGPKDFFKKMKYNYNFNSNNLKELNKRLLKIIDLNYKIPHKVKKILFEKSMNYTLENHFKKLDKLLRKS